VVGAATIRDVHVHGRTDELALGLGERATVHRLGLEVS
jgi:hypothetical protein